MNSTDLPVYYNVVDILEHNLAARADKVALYSVERTMTFREVQDEVNQVGNALKSLGIRFGETVAILAPDSAEWVTTFFGVMKIGAIALGFLGNVGVRHFAPPARSVRAMSSFSSMRMR